MNTWRSGALDRCETCGRRLFNPLNKEKGYCDDHLRIGAVIAERRRFVDEKRTTC